MKKNIKITKALLIHPEVSHSKYDFNGVIENEPLELEYIKKVLNDNCIDCDIFDVQREKISITNKLKKYKPDMIYICGRIKQENFMINYIKTARKICKNSIIIVGGIHAQVNYKKFFINELDYVLTTFDIFKILDIIKGKNLNNISGICYKKNNKWIINKSEPFNINKLPHPDRSYFYKHKNRYRYLDLVPCAQVRTSYSCAFKCSFCYRNLTNCGKYVYRDIEDVVKEIEEIKCNNIYFIDDDFLINPNRIKKFIKLIKEKNIKKKYVCFGRVDFIINNKDIIKELKEIGFYYILVGLESINNNNLKDYNKLININNNIECIKTMNEIGINIMAMFIIDLNFTKKDFKDLYKWIKNNKIKHTAISTQTPIPGTKLYNEYKDKLITTDPEKYDYFHIVAKPNNLSVKRFYLYYYILLIKLFILSKKNHAYDFIDYKYYIKLAISKILKINGE